MALQRVFVGQAWTEGGLVYLLAMNFVRLTDLAISEYEAGRAAFGAYYGPDLQHPERASVAVVTRALGHFETCLTAAHRAIQHCRRLRCYDGTPPSLRSRLPSRYRVLKGRADDKLEAFRNMIQHLEARLLGEGNPPIGEHEMAVLMLQGNEHVDGTATTYVPNRLEVGPLKLPVTTLAGWLRELHDRARQVAEYPGEG